MDDSGGLIYLSSRVVFTSRFDCVYFIEFNLLVLVYLLFWSLKRYATLLRAIQVV